MSLLNINGKKPSEQATKKEIIPEGVIKSLIAKLKKPVWFCNVYDDGSMQKFPQATLGNKIYAFIREKRIVAATKALENIKDKTVLFITLTRKYDPANLKESWLYFKKELPRFLRRLRSLGCHAYIYVKEAHEKGGCHVHLCIVWDKKLSHRKHKNKILLNDVKLRNKIKSLWEGHVDIQIAKDKQIGKYLSKELGKASHIETALKNYNKNWENIEVEKRDKTIKSDTKKMWAIYWATKLNLRMVGTSRNIPALDVQEGENPDSDLINNINNSTKPKIIKTIVLPWTIKNHPDFNLQTGKVEPNSKESILILNYLKNPYPE